MRTEGINEPEFKHLEKQFGGVIPELAVLVNELKNKVAIIFSDAPVFELKNKIEANKIPTEARVGVVSPIDYSVPPGPTGLDPSQINFFHALNISTKIVKGQIEITKDFKVCTKGKKIKASEAALLKKLNMKPFEYGMKINCVYDEGAIVPEEIINIDPSTLLDKFQIGVQNITGLSLGSGYAIEATIPLIIGNSFRNIAALSISSGYYPVYLDSKLRRLNPWLPRRRRPPRRRRKKMRKRKTRRKPISQPRNQWRNQHKCLNPSRKRT